MTVAKKSKRRTLALHKFYDRLEVLNQFYWQSQLMLESAFDFANKQTPTDEWRTPLAGPTKLKGKVGCITNSDFCTKFLENNQIIVRLNALVMCSSALEAYIKDATIIFLLTHRKYKNKDKAGNLNVLGDVVGGPILDSFSLPEPLKYSKHLFGIKSKGFTDAIGLWKQYYKFRCAFAHSGPMVTPRARKELGKSAGEIGRMLKFSEKSFIDATVKASTIATTIDKVIAKRSTRELEAEFEIGRWHGSGHLDAKIWSYFHEIGHGQFSKKQKDNLFSQIIL